ncbi:DUF1624 domain-containing protein [Pedobacter mucosus]|uniref:DUF1624 domain-containing protein n=1 Tax=Pedobacter mucosus TaxID=2895286 RepID=UPI001EE3DE54|nr:heparan-alpha-glucosaminide N-acetyltransferase domain-containing protein [Pedobacter mucosus]UKT62980.1 heparan-alpha-glucosaminide N-acetyltransferase domain-containing protein [Pedobacter mucosus]
MELLNKRILSIDILRGLIMVIMALDHTRDFFHLGGMGSNPTNPETTTIFLFFTRWITHFCAPTFLFLSGISAYLSAQNKDKKQASNFLIKRGFWLVIFEIVFISFALTFNPTYDLVFLTVIWAIGWSMILLGIFSKISHRLVLVIGLILIFGHDLTNYFILPSSDTFKGGLIAVLLTTRGLAIPISPSHIFIFSYAVLPWAGVMFIGFAVGKWYNPSFDSNIRRRNLLYSGIFLLFLFAVLRYFGWYGNPTPRKDYGDLLKNVFSFLDLSKYPPSLQFFGMTLGVSMIFLSVIENVQNRFTKILMVFGKVPFFYYVMHLYLLHLIVIIVFFMSGFGIDDIKTANSPFLFVPPTFGFSLPVVYLFWLFVVVILYKPCIWFHNYKISHSNWWLKYL